ncbi:transcriptional regulator [Altererythrobacter sp. B11]|nr:transcriptional regulator [Altererythrobacter sp. B11]
MMAAGRGWGRGGTGGWGDFGDWGDWGGGRHRRGRMFAGGELRLVLLKLVADEPRHGYELIKAVEELTGGEYAPSPGVVYPTLSLLADEGLIAESENTGDGGRKLFSATEAGRAELADKAEEVEALIARLARVGERGGKGRAPELFRAMANLAGSLKLRVRQGDLDKDQIEQLVDIIDDAAKRIERL